MMNPQTPTTNGLADSAGDSTTSGNIDCAVVLAGGRGTRLRPYTTVLPKPLMPVGDMPILEVVLRQLRGYGFGRVILAVNHQAALIRSYFGDGSPWGIDLEYSQEDEPLGTMGPLHLMADQLPQSFLMMNGDLLTDLDFAGFLEGHRSRPEQLTVAVCNRKQWINYGVIHICESKRLATGFQEKPELDLWVSAGIYALDKSILQVVPGDGPFGFDDLMDTMLARKLPVGVHLHEGEWHDIGRAEDWDAATRSFEANPRKYLSISPREAAVGAFD